MCIRDRGGEDQFAFRAIGQHLAGLGADHLGVEVILPDVQPCLLYTSDAADERSSVDLGGRRIIKKKKNE